MDIECEVTTTRCAPVGEQLDRLTHDELREYAAALNVCGPTLSTAELVQAVAAAILAAREK